jgi:hypothetical protein
MNYLDIFSKNQQTSNFIKIHPERADLFHVDGRTDMTKLIVVFRKVTNAPITDANTETFPLKRSLRGERAEDNHVNDWMPLPGS